MRMQSSGVPAYLHVACGFFVGLSQYAPKRNMTRIVATSVALTLSCCISCTPRLVGLKVEIWSQATLPWSLELFIGLGKYATTEGNSNGFIHPTFDVLNTKEQAQQTGTQITKQYKTLLVSRGNLAIKKLNDEPSNFPSSRHTEIMAWPCTNVGSRGSIFPSRLCTCELFQYVSISF